MAGARSPEVQLAALDLTQLRVLDTLFRERSVRQTAERLHLTSSAISHALGRLREVIDDELFIRQPDGMHPTPRAIEIAPKLKAALDLLHQSLDISTFKPADCLRSFVIALVPYVTSVLLPQVMAELLSEAPNAQFRLQSVNNALVADLDANRMDLALAAFGRLPDSLERIVLREDPFVVAVRRDHPLARGEITLAQCIADFPHVEVMLNGTDAEHVDAYQVKGGVERKVIVGKEEFWQQFNASVKPRRVAMIVPDSATALSMVAETDMVAVVIASAARASARCDKLFLLLPPLPPPPLRLEMVWHRRKTSDPALAWLRSRLSDLVRQLD